MKPESRGHNFSVSAVAHNASVVVQVHGDLDIATEPLLGDAIDTAVCLPAKNLVVDLSAVPFMDSSGCRGLLRARDRAQESGIALELRGVTGRCQRTLEVLDLDGLFTLTDGERGEEES